MFIDISVPLSASTIRYEGDSSFELKTVSRVRPNEAATYNLTRLNMSSHIGTHVDAPLHFAPGGPDVASIDLDALSGEVRVLDLRGGGLAIGKEVLEKKKLKRKGRVLLKTDNCELLGKEMFSREFAHLTSDAARYLRDLETRLVGIDYLSVDPWAPPRQGFGFPAHHELLDPREDNVKPVVILETVDLREVEEGEYRLWCFPLKVLGGEGAPARAVLETL
jgi:arylformamidase